jgi:hypothetical protein
VIILERSRSVSEGELPIQSEMPAVNPPEPHPHPLRGTVLYYEDPFESA